MMINHKSFANDLPEKLLEEMNSSKEIFELKIVLSWQKQYQFTWKVNEILIENKL